MHPRSGLRDVVESERTNAAAGWLLIAFLCLTAAYEFLVGHLLWAGFVLVLALLAVVPAVAYRSPLAMLPAEVLLLAALPAVSRVLVVDQAVGGVVLTGRVTTYLAVAAVALVIAVEIDVFTPVKMNYSFAVLFVVVTTMAAAGVWAVAQWLSDLYLGTAFLLNTGRPEAVVEEALMWDFVAATAAGLGAGVLFEYYFRRRVDSSRRVARTSAASRPGARDSGEQAARMGEDRRPERERELRTEQERGSERRTRLERKEDRVRLRDRIGVSPRRQRQAARAMQVALVGLFFVGVYDLDAGVAVNAGIGLLVTYLPAVLERDYDVPMDAGLTLWITGAVFLHAFGTVGLPGMEESFYRSVWWWDHLTHALSASIVAAVGYTVARAVDEHSDAIYLPARFTFVFVLLSVLAFGVFWEVIEFLVSLLAAAAGADSVLTQYGLEDAMFDLVFDTVGAVVVALWGTAHLSDVVGAIEDRLAERRPE
jgi:hypothetical protein